MFRRGNSLEGLAFKVTLKAYKQTLKRDCTMPCKQINPHDETGLGAEHDAELAGYNLCDVCGIDGNGNPMASCGCCQQAGQETAACLTCIPLERLQ